MQRLWQKIAYMLRLSRVKKRWRTVARILSFVVIFCTTYMLILPAITMEREPYCGIPDHTHTDNCYILSNPELGPDGETYTEWEATLASVEYVKSASDNIASVAASQIGYTESERNYLTDENGEKRGYSRYGQWYGNPYGNWNAMFVSFCLNYARISNVSELTASSASGLKINWEKAGYFESAENHKPSCGELIFIDTDADGETDTVGIVSDTRNSEITAIFGDIDRAVVQQKIENTETVCGYGLSGMLTVDESWLAEDDVSVSVQEEQIASVNTLFPVDIIGEDELRSDIPENMEVNYISDLGSHVMSVYITDNEGNEISNGSTIYIGEEYHIAVEFQEFNTGKVWEQFAHDENGYMHYRIPSNLKVHPFDEWHPITAKTDFGTVENVGEYFVDETGLLRVRFFEVDDGEGGTINFIDKYSNTDFTLSFEAAIANSASGSNTEINFGDQIKVNVNVDGGASMSVQKLHTYFDHTTNQVEYQIKVQATHGLVKNLVLYDDIWNTHTALRDTIVITDLEGNEVDFTPTVTDIPASVGYGPNGFMLGGFPDFAAGQGYLITYRSQILDSVIQSGAETADLWNGLYATGNSGNNSFVDAYDDEWLRVEFKNLEKTGKQATLEDDDGNRVDVLQWDVIIVNSTSDMQGTLIIDTLGEGLEYYTDEPIKVVCYDDSGNKSTVYIPWSNVAVNGNSMSFPLPSGTSFDVTYYTTFTPLEVGEDTKYYYNSVKTNINGKDVETGGSGMVVGFNPTVSKAASGDDGEYVYFTIKTQVPSIMKDRGYFYLTDLAAFWNYPTQGESLYVDNKPEDVKVTATTQSGQTVVFNPYVQGGNSENTYILKAPATDGTNERYHSFEIYFNTSVTEHSSSKWILGEDAELTVTYKIPFTAKTDTDWYGIPDGEQTLEDVLLNGGKMSNEVYFNFSQEITAVGTTNYEYNPIITKSSILNKDGTIDYTVVFRNTIPGSGGNEGYLNYITNNIIFNDTFDERLEYVPGSLEVKTYDPWRDWLWLCTFGYEGAVTGNTLSIPGDELMFKEYNYAEAQYDENGNDLWGTYLANSVHYLDYVHILNSGGRHVFTYTLKPKDEYLYTTEHSKLYFDNVAEITWNNDQTSGPANETTEFITGLMEKNVVQKDSELDFDIHINRNALDILEGASTLTIVDTMTENLSVYWETIDLLYEAPDGTWIHFNSNESSYSYTVTYDAATNSLTFIVPDSLHIRIDYTTLITQTGTVSVNNSVRIEGKAQVTDLINSQFQVAKHSGDASGSVHDLTLLKQDGITKLPLEGASFHLYGPVGDASEQLPEGAVRDIWTDHGFYLHYIGTYTTGADGTVNMSTQYLTEGGPYALVEAEAPPGYDKLIDPVYFYFYTEDPHGHHQSVSTIITVENVMVVNTLPQTGGIGTYTLYIIGDVLIALSAVFLLRYRNRRRKEGSRLRA
ncbi:MAG: LPXTG cell wall anchor domain-containing protein [Clostridia bacterium]|nr:LPXTG cell wall anchor domain-containing protein [Clostridia bacterium]